MEAELLERIKKFEGYRRYAYRCSLDHLTIGYGTMIEDGGHGIPEFVAELLLRDYLETIQTRLKAHDWFNALNEPRQHCILEMAYQMGVEGVLAFKMMIQSLKDKDWEGARTNALDSLWAKQTPARAKDVADRLAVG